MIFGLTGGIATGKSTVTCFFRENQVPIVDADLIARELVLQGSLGRRQIIAEFGPDILTAEGDLDRPKLGALVFGDAEQKARLDAIMRPLILARTHEVIAVLKRAGYPLIGFDAALLFEWGVVEEYRPIVVVACSEDNQLQRLMKRDHLTIEEARARIRSQIPLAEKIRQADFVLDNDGTEEDLLVKSYRVLKVLREMADLQIGLD